ncbi:hypothetical protein [Nocardia salmonicida]|uniref:hypothetical protein n=1 Tax=Nocardia salmonicida TaxID=53431 RepID=UPI0007A4FB61|nr:hypothetical protein [Nocardia salmonicida]
MDSSDYNFDTGTEWLSAFCAAAQLVSRNEVLYDSVGLLSLQTGEGRPVCDFGIIDEIIDRCAKLYTEQDHFRNVNQN